MFNVSTVYKNDMEKQIRPRTGMRIKLGVVDVDAASTAMPSDNGHVFYSDLCDTLKEKVPEKTYGTFEPGRWKCDGKNLAPSMEKPLLQGYVSSETADSRGDFNMCPVIRFDFSKTNTAPALTLVFDQSTDDRPHKARIEAYRKGAIIKEYEFMPDSSLVVIEERFEDFDRLDIVFLKMRVGGRRARLQQIIFGRGLIFESDQLIKCSFELETDPISRRLPVCRFDFSVLNIDGMYNPDNPKGIWRDIENHAAVDADFLQKLESPLTWGDLGASSWAGAERSTWGAIAGGGHVEEVRAGRFYLTAQPSVKEHEAAFRCESVLSLASGDFRKGNFVQGGRSLYSLALEVLKERDLPKMPDGSQPWLLWEGLADIYCAAPLPVKPCRELLQLIAHSACCVLYTDRKGRIRIEPEPISGNEQLFDFDSMSREPEISKTQTLAGVRVKAYSYIGSAEEKELLKENYYISGEKTVEIELASPFWDIKVKAAGAVVKAVNAYSRFVQIVLEGSGNAEIAVFGKEIRTAAALKEISCKTSDGNAVWEEVDNPLITSLQQAEAVAAWLMDYLSLRNTYSFDYRGNPEVDPLDTVVSQSRYTKNFDARVLKNKVEYNGSLRGKMVLKKLGG